MNHSDLNGGKFVLEWTELIVFLVLTGTNFQNGGSQDERSRRVKLTLHNSLPCKTYLFFILPDQQLREQHQTNWKACIYPINLFQNFDLLQKNRSFLNEINIANYTK